MATPGVGITSPVTLATQSAGAVSTNLLQKKWNDNKLYMESLLPDPLFSNQDLIEPVEVQMGKRNVAAPSNAFFLDVTPTDTKAARTVYLTFLKSLNVDPIQGNATQLLGSETTLNLKFSTAQANDYCGGVSTDTFGIDFRELATYGAYDKIDALLAQWLGEVRGYYARYAMVFQRSPNLEAAPISSTAGLNQHFYFPGCTSAQQPSYNVTKATYMTNVGATATTAGALSAGTNRLTVGRCLTLIDWLQTKYIRPVQSKGGRELYILFAHPDEYLNLLGPATTDSWASRYVTTLRTDDPDKVVPGQVGLIGDSLLVVRDPRAPTMALSGTASAYTTTFSFYKYGRTDDRSAAGRETTDFNTNMVFGADALWKYEPEMPHRETQTDVYGKYEGIGLFGAVGYGTPVFDVDTATSSSGQQEGSVIVMTRRE